MTDQEFDSVRAEITRLNDALAREKEAHRHLMIAYAELRRLSTAVIVRHRSGLPMVAIIAALVIHLEEKK